MWDDMYDWVLYLVSDLKGYKYGGTLPHLYTPHTLKGIWERETVIGGEKDSCWIFLITAFDHLTILKKFAGFSPLWFPRGKYLCLVCLGYLVVPVILSDKDPNQFELK